MKAQRCHRLRRLLASAIAFASACCGSALAEVPQEDVSVYSDLCYSERTGDVNRDRLMLVHAFGQYYVVFQTGMGVLQPPVMGQAKIVGDDISFELKRPDGKPSSFSGTIQPQEIVGTFSDERISGAGGKTFRLPRKTLDGYRVLPACGAPPYPAQK